MTPHAVEILRLVLAALNGLLFAAGLYLFFDVLVFRPRRWREELRRLIAEAEREEVAGLEEGGSSVAGQESCKRQRIRQLKERLGTHRQDPRTLLHASFAVLMVVVALVALLMLTYPPYDAFIR